MWPDMSRISLVILARVLSYTLLKKKLSKINLGLVAPNGDYPVIWTRKRIIDLYVCTTAISYLSYPLSSSSNNRPRQIFRNGNLCLSLFSSCWRSSSLIPLTFNTKCRETVWPLTQCLIFYEGSFLKRVDGSSLTKWPQFSIIHMLWALRKVLIT